MTSLSAKWAALSAIAVMACLAAGNVRAEIVRSTDGAPVLSTNGNCVISGWEGSEQCEAAKAAAGMGAASQTTVDRERVVYFDFNKSSLTADAKQHLDHLAKKLHWMQKHDHVAANITIVGYADRIGNVDYNQKLGMKRAQTVRAYLTAKGVKARNVEVRSLGESKPMANCPPNLKRAKMIQCLKEDRRVEIEVNDK